MNAKTPDSNEKKTEAVELSDDKLDKAAGGAKEDLLEFPGVKKTLKDAGELTGEGEKIIMIGEGTAGVRKK